MGDSVKSGDILLVEDNPGDVRYTKEMLKEAGLEYSVWVVNNGIEALDYLHQRGEYVDAPRPDFILLDWHLPKKGGEELLSEFKQDEDINDIPVIVLSGSGVQIERIEEKSPQADKHIPKPLDPEDCLALVDEFSRSE